MTTTFTFEAPGDAPFVPAPESAGTSPYGTDLVQNPDHAGEAISHLIEFFRNGPRNQAVLRAVGAQIQELETAFWALLKQRDVDTAVGAQLDILGRIVGERDRGIRTDEDFRAAIRVRILVNSSDGKAEQLITIIRRMLPDSVITLTENYPAALTIEVLADFGEITVFTLKDLMQDAKPGGVRIDVLATNATDAFIWAESDTVDLDHGWGSDTDPTLGGDWSEVA